MKDDDADLYLLREKDVQCILIREEEGSPVLEHSEVRQRLLRYDTKSTSDERKKLTN